MPRKLITEPLPFVEAVDFITKKQDQATGLKTREIAAQWDEETTRKAFFSARVASADLLSELHRRVSQVVNGDMTDQQARELLRVFLEGEGAGALAALGFAPPNLEGGVAELGSVRRLQLILAQNTKMAQEVGAYAQWKENWDIAPYGRWHVGESKEHRLEHLAREGMLFRYDHPIWTQDPPGGQFNCRCWREELTEDEVQALGLTPAGNDFAFTKSPLKFDPSKGIDQLPEIKPATLPEVAHQLQPELADPIKEKSSKVREELKKRTGAAGLKLDPEIDKIPDAAILKATKQPDIDVTGKNKSFYTRDANTITMCKSAKKWAGQESVFAHEFGHHLHHETGTVTPTTASKSLDLAMDSDYSGFLKQAEAVYGKAWYGNLDFGRVREAALTEHVKHYGLGDSHANADDLTKQRVAGFMDTLACVSRCSFGFGHSKSYFAKRPTGRQAETFANLFRAICFGWVEYEKAFPAAWAEVRKAVGL
jgi:hypothetical protein